MSIPKGIPEDHLPQKPTCGHKPPPGYRELAGEELVNHMKQMEKEGYLTTRTYRRSEYITTGKGHCLHLYVKI